MKVLIFLRNQNPILFYSCFLVLVSCMDFQLGHSLKCGCIGWNKFLTLSWTARDEWLPTEPLGLYFPCELQSSPSFGGAFPDMLKFWMSEPISRLRSDSINHFHLLHSAETGYRLHNTHIFCFHGNKPPYKVTLVNHRLENLSVYTPFFLLCLNPASHCVSGNCLDSYNPSTTITFRMQVWEEYSHVS